MFAAGASFMRPLVVLKNIQRGTISTSGASNTATITSVDTNNALARLIGCSISSGTAAQSFSRIDLTNATTVTAVINSSGGGTFTSSYEVVEYFPGYLKSAQRGTITTAGVASNTATITSVDTTKSQVDHLGLTNNDGGSNGNNWLTRLTLTNATTVTCNVGGTGATQITGYQVSEGF